MWIVSNDLKLSGEVTSITTQVKNGIVTRRFLVESDGKKFEIDESDVGSITDEISMEEYLSKIKL